MEITEANNRFYIPEVQGQHSARNFIHQKAGVRLVSLMVKDRWMYKHICAIHHVANACDITGLAICLNG